MMATFWSSTDELTPFLLLTINKFSSCPLWVDPLNHESGAASLIWGGYGCCKGDRAGAAISCH